MKTSVYEHRWSIEDKQDPDPKSVLATIQRTKFVPKPKFSSALKGELLVALQQQGWSSEVEIDAASNISITSVKNESALCFQTGNMARMYADLMKLQTVFAKKVVARGVFIIPTKLCADVLGSNIANFERLSRELTIFDLVITMPLLVIGIE